MWDRLELGYKGQKSIFKPSSNNLSEVSFGSPLSSIYLPLNMTNQKLLDHDRSRNRPFNQSTNNL